MFKKILVPLDGSTLSEAVFPWLNALVNKLAPEAEIVLLRAFEPPSTVYLLPELSIPTTNALSDEYVGGLIMEYLQNRAERLEGLKVSTHMTMGDPASEILEMAEGADLVVMASHGRGGLGRWLLGSVATKVVRGCTVPVLVIGGKALEEGAPPTFSRFMVPLDGSEVAERAFSTACRLAQGLEGALHLYAGVVQVESAHEMALKANRAGVEHFQDYLQEMAERESRLEIDCTVKETHGKTGIVEFADKIGADLIVMGSHGRTGFQRWAVGSETENTLHHAHCPVLVTH